MSIVLIEYRIEYLGVSMGFTGFIGLGRTMHKPLTSIDPSRLLLIELLSIELIR